MEYFNGSDQEALKTLQKELMEQLKIYQDMSLNLNMARGKPCSEQLDLSNGLLDGSIDFSINTDYRNYGILDGIPEIKAIFKDMLEVSEEELIVGGNSSLTLMYDTLSKAMLFGTLDSDRPWSKEEKVKFICPVPGYDRHFSICETLGIEMISVSMDENGPDMEKVCELVASDSSIKGMWCVPKYSNPSGITYSDEVVKTLASMETAAKDFKIMWDNAYVVHHLYDEEDQLLNILDECKKAGTNNRVYMFSSTSKVTFPGAGVAMMAGSVANMNYIRKQISFQSIGPNKINQLMHAKFLPSMEAIHDHMKKQAKILKPKFEVVEEMFNKEFKDLNIASWTKPNGGYFVSLDVMDGCAKKIVELCKETGVTLTGAGATHPYKQDPNDSNIRIAPTYPPYDELVMAINVLTLCVKIVSLEKILQA